MDSCMRLLSLAARDSRAELPRAQELYRDFVSGAARGSEVISYISARRASRVAGSSAGWRVEGPDIDRLEAPLYAGDRKGDVDLQVQALLDGRTPSRPGSLAPHHRRREAGNPEEKPRLEQLRNRIRSCAEGNPRTVLVDLARTIDLHHGSVRR